MIRACILFLCICTLVSGCSPILGHKENLDRAIVHRDIETLGKYAEAGDVNAIHALSQFTNNPSAVSYLLQVLDSGAPYAKKVAAQSLIYHLGNEEARIAIAEHLENADAPIRFGILKGLERTNSVDKETRSAFIKIALNDLNPSIRMEAAITLRKLGDYSSGDIVYDLLGEDYIVVRRKAAKEIQYYPNIAYTPRLNMLKNDKDLTVKNYAILALEKLPADSDYRNKKNNVITESIIPIVIKNTTAEPDVLSKNLRSIVPGTVKKTNFLFVIGVSEYDELPMIPYSRESASMFAQVMQRKMGVPKDNVWTLYDEQATGTRIYSRFNDMLNRITSDSVVYFYYSGHGVPSRDGESSYLLPADSSMGVYEDPRMELHNMLSTMAKKHPKKIIAVIDSCFSGKISADKLLFEGIAPAILIQPKIQALPSDVTLALAAKENEFSNAYEQKRHRLFSYYYIKALCSENKTMAEIAQYVSTNVTRHSAKLGRSYSQHPQFRGTLNNITIKKDENTDDK